MMKRWLILLLFAAVVLPVEGIAQQTDGAQPSDSQPEEPREHLEQIGRDLRAAIERGEISTEDARARYEAARTRLSASTAPDENEQRRSRIIAAAMDKAPEDWSDRLKAAIVEEGWDLAGFTDGIRRRQAHRAEQGTAGDQDVAPQTEPAATQTAVEARSWAELKLRGTER